MYQDFAVQCTWEGDNTVLMLQCGRYLISCYRDSLKGKQMPLGVAYLNEKNVQGKKFKGGEVSLEDISDAFDVARVFMLANLFKEFEDILASGNSEEFAYEKCCKYWINFSYH